MATKVFCDGCGAEVQPYDVRKLAVTFSRPGLPDNGVHRDFDLCPSCEGYFRNNSVPSAWPRATPSNP